jgi:hypothetical protein
LDNLKNVAIPGTGIALSWFCYSKYTALIFVFLLNPLLCFLGAVNQARVFRHTDTSSEFLRLLEEYFTKNLLHPDDWFSLWRMNSHLVSFHSMVTGSQDYKMEDKWTFLVSGKALQVPVSPFNDQTEAIVCKNKMIEGGMGIHFYRNAAYGGDWIIQDRLQNAPWLNALLPQNAPLSTMRVITTSSFTLSAEYPLRQNRELLNKSSLSLEDEDETDDAIMVGNERRLGRGEGLLTEHGSERSSPVQEDAGDFAQYINAESAVLRLGRMHAQTDHSSILFDVDVATGIIQGGTTNAHWYQLGLDKVQKTPWLPPPKRMRQHIDPPYPQVLGQQVPNMQEALAIVKKAHYTMMPEVPIVGWDVAFTSKGIFLLEVNLSCNFFRGTVDIPHYIDFVHRQWLQLEKIAQLNADFQENHTTTTSPTEKSIKPRHSTSGSALAHQNAGNTSSGNLNASSSSTSNANNTNNVSGLINSRRGSKSTMNNGFIHNGSLPKTAVPNGSGGNPPSNSAGSTSSMHEFEDLLMMTGESSNLVDASDDDDNDNEQVQPQQHTNSDLDEPASNSYNVSNSTGSSNLHNLSSNSVINKSNGSSSSSNNNNNNSSNNNNSNNNNNNNSNNNNSNNTIDTLGSNTADTPIAPQNPAQLKKYKRNACQDSA